MGSYEMKVEVHFIKRHYVGKNSQDRMVMMLLNPPADRTVSSVYLNKSHIHIRRTRT